MISYPTRCKIKSASVHKNKAWEKASIEAFRHPSMKLEDFFILQNHKKKSNLLIEIVWDELMNDVWVSFYFF